MILNVIHLPNSTASAIRKANIDKQIAEQNIHARFWDGIKDNQMPFRGVNRAHKQIVLNAQLNGEKMVAIAEDDVVFSDAGAWDYFLAHIPDEFDIYFGGVTEFLKKDEKIVSFRGLFLYIVHERFYDRYLSVKEESHIDASLSTLLNTKYIISDPFICYHADGWSEQKHCNRNYSNYFQHRKFFQKKS